MAVLRLLLVCSYSLPLMEFNHYHKGRLNFFTKSPRTSSAPRRFRCRLGVRHLPAILFIYASFEGLSFKQNPQKFPSRNSKKRSFNQDKRRWAGHHF